MTMAKRMDRAAEALATTWPNGDVMMLSVVQCMDVGVDATEEVPWDFDRIKR
jgi:hypothetical protein